MHESVKAVYDALEKALKTPDLPIGYSIPTNHCVIAGNTTVDFPKFSPVLADGYGRLWREDHGDKIVLISANDGKTVLFSTGD